MFHLSSRVAKNTSLQIRDPSPIASKLMEHILVSNIMKHAQSYNILYGLQLGFRSCVSCETQLIQFTHDLVTNMQSGAQTDVILMDFSKTFDKVSHNKLIDKL